MKRMGEPSQSGTGSSTRQHTSPYVDVCCGMKLMEAPSQSGSDSRRMGGVRACERVCLRACVRASLAMDSCRTPPTHPLGTRLTTSALLLEAFFPFPRFFEVENFVFRLCLCVEVLILCVCVSRCVCVCVCVCVCAYICIMEDMYVLYIYIYVCIMESITLPWCVHWASH
jgi:hypothetical protein